MLPFLETPLGQRGPPVRKVWINLASWATLLLLLLLLLLLPGEKAFRSVGRRRLGGSWGLAGLPRPLRLPLSLLGLG